MRARVDGAAYGWMSARRKAFMEAFLARRVSKAHDPHWRYVALRIEGQPVGRRALQNALLGRARREGVADVDAPQLTRLQWPHAIVRVHHHQLAAARQWLGRVDFAVEGDARVPLQVQTLSSSGTIKALTQRLGILQERAERPSGPRPAARAGETRGGARSGGSAQDGNGRGRAQPREAGRPAAAGDRQASAPRHSDPRQPRPTKVGDAGPDQRKEQDDVPARRKRGPAPPASQGPIKPPGRRRDGH